jgi:hypothetical protein
MSGKVMDMGRMNTKMIQAVLQICIAVCNFCIDVVRFKVSFEEWLINLVLEQLLDIFKYTVQLTIIVVD